MSTSTVVTVHCDACAEWVYASSMGQSTLEWRRAIGWTMDLSTGRREDFCPACSTARAEAAAG